MEITARVTRIGNSLGIIIPKKVAKRVGIDVGAEVTLEIRKTPRTIYGILKNAKLDPEKAKVFKEDEKW